jgi:hypothetical protein
VHDDIVSVCPFYLQPAGAGGGRYNDLVPYDRLES